MQARTKAVKAKYLLAKADSVLAKSMDAAQAMDEPMANAQNTSTSIIWFYRLVGV